MAATGRVPPVTLTQGVVGGSPPGRWPVEWPVTKVKRPHQGQPVECPLIIVAVVQAVAGE